MKILGYRPFNPGLARHAITWQEKSVSGQDTFGQDTYTWADVVSVRANITALQGREMEAARQKWADAQYRIEQHFYAGFKRAWRGAWLDGGTFRYLQVLDVQDAGGMGRVHILICSEAVE